ncbi:hypothetical protein OIU83_04715 [Flavobacterium sp. LS1R49]|uniref:Peptidoglycan binding-like domain-containing protein n=1 Tax=Flavobacterium shii TaxID=2987687 RepID=A0A9X3C6N6_9FLAO|nr:hypothetical protein [Flavobacterium shii]MCV9926938.1 hypothetical protein [Flavobacterium shii]
MSNFKIIGSINPEVGKEVTYTVTNSNLPGSLFPGQVIPLGSNPFVPQVQWSVYVLKYGKWQLKEKNNKTGPKAAYTFTEISLTRQAIRIVARMGEEKVTLDIKPQKTVERKIISVELCDALGKKQTKPFAYNQTVLARVHCLNLDNCTVNVTLWEDDAPGEGHSEINKNNKAVTKSELISNGIADIKFRLATDFAKMANAQLAKGDKSEGKFHEYYVTAEIFRQKTISSNNINVINPDNKTPDAKPKPTPSKPTPQKPKPPVPAATKGKSQMEEKGIVETVGSAIYDWGESKLKVLSTILPDPMEIVNSVSKLATPDKKEEKDVSCGEKYCIKKGDSSELIREINIRLAGFGGNVPTDKFTDRTEKMIKQFQRDYMKVPETGKICGNVLFAIDDFSSKFDISNTFWNQIKCSCSTKGKKVISKLKGISELNSCDGFGDHTGKGTYGGNTESEKFYRYEYPGIHRSLLFGIKALQFYFSKQTTYKIDHITSGYRCRFKNYTTTNHQGKAIDIQFSKGTLEIRGEKKEYLKDLRDIRDNIYIKYLGAQKEWPAKNLYSIEPIDLLYDKKGNVRFDHTFSWIHVDVREFDSIYLDDKYFCKNSTKLNGNTILQLAKDSGFEKTCMCLKPKALVEPPKKEIKEGCYCNKDLTSQILKDIGISNEKATEFLEAINKTFTDYQINTCLRKAHFLAQVIHESGGFRYTAELNVADTAYDGFKGRGLIQLTGEANYKKYGTYEKQDFTSSLENKIKLEKLPYSARSSGWFWKQEASLNDEADINDHIYITRIVNGGYNGYNDRLKYLKNGFKNLYNNCKNDSGKSTDFAFDKSKSYNDKRGAFAWGLWHDPGLNKEGCTKDKEKAIQGYSRFIDLAGDNYAETNWYNIKKISSFSNLKYTVKKKEYVKVLDAAKQRLKALKT